MDVEPTESTWVRLKEKMDEGDTCGWINKWMRPSTDSWKMPCVCRCCPSLPQPP